jgi:glyoxylase-like metal-dependent hydrolase (beta-lactamase superfamily II)
MQIVQLIVGSLGTNCYLVSEEGSPETLVIDPGAEALGILETVKETGGVVSGIICTHGHPDHTGALRQIVAATEAPIHIHPADAPLLRRTWPDFFVDEPPAAPGTVVREVREGEVVGTGSLALRVLHTPGHTPGGICLVAEEAAFTGDTLFAGGVGRSDLHGGDAALLEESLHRLTRELSPITLIYPGHGEATVMTQELASNLWLAAGPETGWKLQGGNP